AAFPRPPPNSKDDDVKSQEGRLSHPEHLPDALNEALVAIDDLGSPQGHRALEAAPEWPAMLPLLAPDSTREDIAMQLWLAAPDFLARVHNSLRLRRLTAFEHAA